MFILKYKRLILDKNIHSKWGEYVLYSAVASLFLFNFGCQPAPSHNPIAFSRLTGDYWQIWTMQPEGTHMKQITISPSDKRYPVWSLTGERILYRNNNSELFNVDLKGSKEERIFASLGLNGGIVPSPNGEELLLVRYDSLLKDSCNLWLTTSGGKNARKLTRGMGLQYDPSWSPDGVFISYISGHGFRTDELFVMKSDGTAIRRLTKNDAKEALPSFCPDGKTIAYASDETGDYEIWVIDIENGSKKRLTNIPGIDTRPWWSPDGAMIIFVSNRSGTLQLWIMNADGSNQRQLTTGAPSTEPVWRKEPF